LIHQRYKNNPSFK